MLESAERFISVIFRIRSARIFPLSSAASAEEDPLPSSRSPSSVSRVTGLSDLFPHTGTTLLGAGLAVAGSITGVTEIGAIGSIVLWGGTQGLNAGNLAQAEILDNVFQENPNADRNKVLQDTFLSWGAVTAMNTADPMLTAKLAGIGKLTNGVGNVIRGKIFSDVATSKTLNTLEKETGKKVVSPCRKPSFPRGQFQRLGCDIKANG